MATETWDALAIMERLEQVERQDRFLKRLVMGLLFGLVGAVALILGLSKGPYVLEAREFILRDGSGHPRAVWKVTEDGGLGLHLLDQQGIPRASLSVTSEGSPALSLNDDHEDGSIAAIAVTDEGPALALYDSDGKPIFTKP